MGFFFVGESKQGSTSINGVLVVCILSSTDFGESKRWSVSLNWLFADWVENERANWLCDLERGRGVCPLLFFRPTAMFYSHRIITAGSSDFMSFACSSGKMYGGLKKLLNITLTM